MGRPRKNPDQGLPLRVYLKSGSFYYVHADNRWEKLGRDLASATKKAEAYNSGKSLTGTMAHWLDEWLLELALQVKAGQLSTRTQLDYIKACVPLKVFFGHMLPTEIETPHVSAYITLGRDSGRPVRANREKAALSSCMSWMVAWGKAGLKSNPCKGAPRNTEKDRGRYISDDEFSAVYALASAPIKAWMDLVYRTLQRPSDILKWTRNNIVVEGGKELLSFRQGKTQEWVKIEVTASLRRAFDDMAAARKEKSLYLICQRDGSPYKLTGIAGMYRRHVAAAGLVDFGIYDLKGKGATDMYNGGTPLATICALCAHASERTTEIYIKARNPRVVQPNEREIVSKTAGSSP